MSFKQLELNKIVNTEIYKVGVNANENEALTNLINAKIDKAVNTYEELFNILIDLDKNNLELYQDGLRATQITLEQEIKDLNTYKLKLIHNLKDELESFYLKESLTK